MKREKVIEFDYEKFLQEDPMRTKVYDEVFDIVGGFINESKYRTKYNDFNDARITLDDADTRIKIFSEDTEESGIKLNEEVDYLYALVEDARRNINGITMRLKQ